MYQIYRHMFTTADLLISCVRCKSFGKIKKVTNHRSLKSRNSF